MSIDNLTKKLSKISIGNKFTKNYVSKNKITKRIILSEKEVIFILKNDDSIFTTDQLVDIDEYFKRFVLNF